MLLVLIFALWSIFGVYMLIKYDKAWPIYVSAVLMLATVFKEMIEWQ